MLPVQPEGASRTVIVGVEAYLAGMRARHGQAFDTFRDHSGELSSRSTTTGARIRAAAKASTIEG